MRSMALPKNHSIVYTLVTELLDCSDILAMSQHYQAQKTANPELIEGTAGAWMFALDIFCKQEDIKTIYQIIEDDLDGIFSFSKKDKQRVWYYLAETNQKEVLLNTFKKQFTGIFSDDSDLFQYTYAFRAFPASFYKILNPFLEPFLREIICEADLITKFFDDTWPKSKEDSEKKLTLCSLFINQINPIEVGELLAELINSAWDSMFPAPQNLEKVILQLIDAFFNKATEDDNELCSFLHALDKDKLKFVVSKLTPQLDKIFENKGLNFLLAPEGTEATEGLKLTIFKIICKALAQIKNNSITGLEELNLKLATITDNIGVDRGDYQEIYQLATRVKFAPPIEKLFFETWSKINNKRAQISNDDENPFKKQKI